MLEMSREEFIRSSARENMVEYGIETEAEALALAELDYEVAFKVIASAIIILAVWLFSLLAWDICMHGKVDSGNAFWVIKSLH